MNSENIRLAWLDGNVISPGLHPHISQLDSSIRERCNYAEPGSSFYIRDQEQVELVDWLLARIGYFQLKVTRPFLVLQILESSFFFFLDLDLEWYVLRYCVIQNTFLRGVFFWPLGVTRY
jgi:hypothetical protein